MGCLASLPEGLDFESPVCIDAKTTASLVQIMRDEVEIEVAENRAVRFTDKNASFRVPVLVIDELPQFPECSEQFVKAPYIHQAIKAVSPFVMDPLSAKVYAGIRLLDDNVIATNYKVLAIAPIGASTKLDAILGPNLIEQFERHHVDSQIAIDQNRAFVKSNSEIFFGALSEGVFLDHTSYMNRWKFINEFVIKHESLKDALPKLSIIGREEDMTATHFKCGDGKVIMSARGTFGEVVVTLPAETTGSAEFKLNTQLVAKWFRPIDGLTFTMAFTDGAVDNDPIRFKGDMQMPDGQIQPLTAYVVPMVDEAKGSQSDDKE
jgi:DNA polymerase III sliding clamp (beta) subunit (PCNA family)